MLRSGEFAVHGKNILQSYRDLSRCGCFIDTMSMTWKNYLNSCEVWVPIVIATQSFRISCSVAILQSLIDRRSERDFPLLDMFMDSILEKKPFNFFVNRSARGLRVSPMLYLFAISASVSTQLCRNSEAVVDNAEELGSRGSLLPI